jgi:hypothetical protein
MADSNMAYDILCDDQDFNNALVIVKTLLRHTLKLYGSVVRAADTKTLNLKGIDGRKDVKNLWDNLPEEFSSAEFKQLSHELGISHRTTERWLQRWVAEESVTRVSQGQYKKIAE